MLKTAFYPQLWRQLGSQDLEDRIHEVWMMVYEAIMNGEVREPERLMGFVSTVVRRAIASQIKKIVRTRRRTTGTPQVDWLPDGQPDQETSLAEREQREVVRRVLAGLKPEEREILCRFYVSDQSAEQICFEMHITPTQFRVGKSRAFARFTAKGREMQGTVGAA
jgi:RNA polymerase sigma factor (sigma-70 family)